MSTGGEDVQVRLVGFRNGTDAELAAQLLVESEIEAERFPGTAPQPFALYAAWARNLPSQFDDHTWVAETGDGTTIGCSACWSNAAGDPHVMESYVYVRQPWRRHGVGRELTRPMLDVAAGKNTALLIWNTYDTIPGGAPFAARLGGTAGRVNRMSELTLARLDWDMVEAWIDGCAGKASGYRLEFREGAYPPELFDDAATFHHILQTAPRDELDIGDVMLDASHVEELERALVATGRERWTIFVRDAGGVCVGGTEIQFKPWDVVVAMQQNTAIHPEHRGHGLAKWAKAVMLDRMRNERPEVERVRTGNAFSNEPMLAINNALGFEAVESRTEWQGSVEDLRRALA